MLQARLRMMLANLNPCAESGGGFNFGLRAFFLHIFILCKFYFF